MNGRRPPISYGLEGSGPGTVVLLNGRGGDCKQSKDLLAAEFRPSV